MYFTKLFNYLFHPVFMPFTGTIAYFVTSPAYIPEEARKSIIIPVLILTLIVPVLLYFLFRNLGWIRSAELSDIEDRKIPLYAAIPIIFIISIRITPEPPSEALHYYFTGILGTLLCCLVLVILKIRASIHMMGITGLSTFVLGLSLHYHLNMTSLLAALIIFSGIVASSGLHQNTHNNREILLGMALGIIPQTVVFPFWL
ncbi:hypothetical protein [Sinomicrobium oceani]|uniref:hypothetical protein n=1 Tax=Sinomicrobium oceani TaxID=1150368 RepID=UPI00227A8CC1|nr:hypothetical protein [Sinomicrobium oceani]